MSYCPQQTKTNSNRQLNNVTTCRRIQRKPSTRNLNSCKSAFSFKDVEEKAQKVEQKQRGNGGKIGDRVREIIGASSEHIVNRSISFVSPKYSKMPNIFSSVTPRTSQDATSIDGNRNREFTECINDSESQKIIDTRRSKNKTSKTIQPHAFNFVHEVREDQNQNQDCSRTSTKKMQQKLLSIQKQKDQLVLQNLQLKEKLNFIQGQNGGFVRQNLKLKHQINVQTLKNQQIQKDYQNVSAKMKQYQNQFEKLSSNVKLKQEAQKSYRILEHMFMKLKYEQQLLQQKNRNLESQNDKLSTKVQSLTKMLDSCDKSVGKRKLSSGKRQLSPFYGKQNRIQNKNPNIGLLVQQKTPRNSNVKRRDDKFFELSPE